MNFFRYRYIWAYKNTLPHQWVRHDKTSAQQLDILENNNRKGVSSFSEEP